jgi:chromosome partitioning protein
VIIIIIRKIIMILTVGNTKGGVGKSTIACNFAVESALAGKKTLLIDADIQGSSIGFRATRQKDDIKAMSITTPTLHKDVKDFNFDIVIIDVGGRDSAVFRSAIMACDVMLIPVLPSQYDIWATGDTIKILKEARTYRDIPAYFMMNQVIPKTVVAREAIQAVEEFKNDVELMKSLLCSRVAYKNSVSYGQGVTEYEPDGKAAQEIRDFYKEVMELWEGKK